MCPRISEKSPQKYEPEKKRKNPKCAHLALNLLAFALLLEALLLDALLVEHVLLRKFLALLLDKLLPELGRVSEARKVFLVAELVDGMRAAFVVERELGGVALG